MLTPFFMMLTSIIARADHASTRLPPGLFRQLARVAGRPLGGNPSHVLGQFLPSGEYRIQRDNGRREHIEVRSDVLSTRVGDLFLLPCHHWFFHPTGGMTVTPGRTTVEADGEGWALNYEFHHRGPITNPSAEALVHMRFTLKIGANRELRELSWDWQKLRQRRQRGRIRFLRTRPPPSRRCDALSPHPHPEDILVKN